MLDSWLGRLQIQQWTGWKYKLDGTLVQKPSRLKKKSNKLMTVRVAVTTTIITCNIHWALTMYQAVS